MILRAGANGALFPFYVAIAVALFLSLVATRAAAHAVNLSQSDFSVDGPSIHALLVFAKADAARLGKMDPDGDGIVTSAELEASQPVFRALVEKGVEVTGDGASCPATLEGGGDVAGDGFGLSVRFACAVAPRAIGISMNFLSTLLPDHRHLLRVHSGSAQLETVLTAAAPHADFTLDAAAVPAAAPAFAAAVRLGIEHILTGWDHLLFLLALLLGARGRGLRSIVAAISAFTVAHSITLALAALGVVALRPSFVEPAIAASIAYVAFENAFHPQAPHRWRLTFAFGLLHGFGFASALRDLALPRERLLPTLFGFNVGVELGQLLAVALAAPLLAFAFPGRTPDSRPMRGASIALGVVGLALLVARARAL